MFIVDEILVGEEIATERFSCDLALCKGACCTLEGGRGAPLLDDEKDLIEKFLPVIGKRLQERNLGVIRERGVADGYPGSYATTCIDDRDCVFVTREAGVARCAIEKSYLAGEIPWRKPVSCHLFPLRFTEGSTPALRYEVIGECEAGRRRGAQEGNPLHRFVKESLVRRFGAAWYMRFEETCAERAALVGNGSPNAQPTGRKARKEE